MNNIYAVELAVSPFIIGPGYKEATLLLGPQALAERGDYVASHLYGPLAAIDLAFPFFAHIHYHDRRLIVTTTVRTTIPDLIAGRQGQKISVGAWVVPEIFMGNWEKLVCSLSFDFLSRFIESTTGKRLEEGGGSRLVSMIQKNAIASPFDGLEDLLRRFGAEFWLQSRARPSLRQHLSWQLRTRRYLSRPRIQPCETFSEILAYWRYADLRLTEYAHGLSLRS